MNKGKGLLLVAVILMTALGVARGADPVWRSSGDQARLEIGAVQFPDSLPMTWTVALPATGGWRVTGFEVDGLEQEIAGSVILSEPFVWRRIRSGQIGIEYREQGWSRAVLRLRFDDPLPDTGGIPDDQLLSGIYVNPGQMVSRQMPDRGGRTGNDIFDGGGNWIRVDIAQSGLYRIDYDDLSENGILAGTGMAGFRLLGSMGKSQPHLMGDPDPASWQDDWELTEIPLEIAGGDNLNGDTEIRFYAPGADGFLSEYQAGADWKDYNRNFYTNYASYYLTWGGEPGLRVQSADATPDNLDQIVTDLPVRIHREENNVYYSYSLHEDGWAWEYFYESTIPRTFETGYSLLWPAAGEPSTLRLGFDDHGDFEDHELRVYLDRQEDDYKYIDEVFHISGRRVQKVFDVEKPLPSGMEGAELSRLYLNLPLENVSQDYGYLLWYELYYQTRLRTRYSRPFDIYLPEQSGKTGLTFSGWENRPRVWDVTHPDAPLELTGGVWDGDSLSIGLTATERRHLILTDESKSAAYREPDNLQQVTPVPLRNGNSNPHMIVIYYDEFQGPAQTYAQWRRAHFPLLGTGEVETVAISDLYANFSSGMRDPAAIRNFLKYRYDTPGSRLSYVLLLGDADNDYRNFLQRETGEQGSNCLIPAFSDRYRTDLDTHMYTTDDYMMALDPEDDSVKYSIPDLASGRLPVSTLAQAETTVAAAIAYERDSVDGIWKNQMVMAADDNLFHCIPGAHDYYIGHTRTAERIVHNAVPPSMDVKKIYMVEYECDYAGFKPAAQNDLFDILQEGVLLFNYVGHGGNDVLSDEQLLLTSRLSSLTNASKRFLFVSASCKVGKYDDSSGKSMSETMILLESGGAIGTMAASATAYAGFNERLNLNIISELFPRDGQVRVMPMGSALLRSKVQIQVGETGNQGMQTERYTLLGDPALTLNFPQLQVQFDPLAVDTLIGGQTISLSGGIYQDGLFAADFNGEILINVRASADTSGYEMPNGNHVKMLLDGPEFLRGRFSVNDGHFETPEFFIPAVPEYAYGHYGRVRGCALGADGNATGCLDSLEVAPGVIPSLDTRPEVVLSLANGSTTGSPGTELVLRASSEVGINFVGTDPRRSIFVEYVGTGIVENLTDRFLYNEGSVSSGEARSYLPQNLEPGRSYQLVAMAADNLGNVGRDTLQISVVAGSESGGSLYDVQEEIFPNPFDGLCLIGVRLNTAARIRCELFTITGRRVKSMEMECPGAGKWAFEWDGRDNAGDQVGNGTYLYRLLVNFSDNPARSREMKGALVRIRD
jgi:hypothetical protein